MRNNISKLIRHVGIIPHIKDRAAMQHRRSVACNEKKKGDRDGPPSGSAASGIHRKSISMCEGKTLILSTNLMISTDSISRPERERRI